MAIKNYVRVDRVTGKVMGGRRSEETEIKRAFHKPTVWIEFEIQTKPSFNPATHKAVMSESHPDLSDLAIDVPPDTKRTRSWTIVALTTAEKNAIRDTKIDNTNNKMARIVEHILVKIATKNGVALEKSDFPAKVWTAVNARRALRGESPV
jgi:hypothetical protein